MDHLSDYVQWMEDFPISSTGFRDEDALILCALSYVDLSPLFSSASDRPTVRDCLKMIESGQLRVMITGSNKGFAELLGYAARSKRYGNLRISDYVDAVRKDPPMQFSAMCFQDEKDFSFIAFRGTDSSLAAWKEDFMISFTRTEAQEMALQYAEKHIEAGRRWYIGGHSKGGNLALYASCQLSEQKWACVERLYLLDCPGICPEVLDLSLQDRVDAKSIRIVPSFCVIGKLFEPKITDTRIVQSFVKGFPQHPLITWGIDHGKLALAKQHDPESMILSEAINDWISDISQSDRVVLTNELFDALSAGGAETIEHIQEGGLEGLEAILRQISEFSTTTRNMLSDLPKYTWKARTEAMRNWLAPEKESKQGLDLWAVFQGKNESEEKP